VVQSIPSLRTSPTSTPGLYLKERKMPLPPVGSTAPAFSLPNHEGETVSLADYAGGSVLLWFFSRAFGSN
jgi:hypothetical protein